MDIEGEYIKGLNKGSYKDFTKLYHLYAPRLYAFVFKLVRSEPIAKDIVQETFIKVWEKRADIDNQLSFKSLLFTIARNQLLNEVRNHISRTELTDKPESFEHKTIDEQSNAEDYLSLAELKKQLEQAKQKLTPRQRELFELSREKGLSITEIIERTAISEQSIRNQLSQAIQRLREELKQYFNR